MDLPITLIAEIGAKALWLTYLWLASAILASLISSRKGYGERPGLAAGLLLSAIGVIVWLVWPARADSRWKREGPLPRRRAIARDELGTKPRRTRREAPRSRALRGRDSRPCARLTGRDMTHFAPRQVRAASSFTTYPARYARPITREDAGLQRTKNAQEVTKPANSTSLQAPRPRRLATRTERFVPCPSLAHPTDRLTDRMTAVA